MDEIIKAEGVSYRYYGSIPALAGVSLGIGAGERFAVIGANGSGKSTLLQVLGGLVFPSEGTVSFRGHEVSEKSLREKGFLRFFRERVGYVFQDSDIQLFCPTVLDELLYGPQQLSMAEEEARERAFAVMQMLNIENLKDRPPYMLSGGEKKRVAIGSVLTMNPEVLLFDEPTNGLDPRTQCFLVELLLALNEAGKTVVLATHDLSLIGELHARVAVLSEDHWLEKTGSAEEVLEDEELLLKVNLIHEHIHFHGKTAHRHLHSHFPFHRHENHIPHIHTIPEKEKQPMNELDKLKHLLHHWQEHNDEHADTYKEWSQKMSALGRQDLAGVLDALYRDASKLGTLFEEAMRMLK
ncbi:MAG: energy-coupling factor ABC transporter ATP-binding protein [Alphaproteobacteria bacterium]|uniref:Energy-coupling factor ABC transporter ATP-binding protein n=1 Tax=Candidatus Nitrobium versatile TaxID=2884831 RepID=A0A953JDC0_9BACT|nr:energy-coupling factor ABC transporter ATP-binding protein [Candidatus Nitrobium versatile]